MSRWVALGNPSVPAESKPLRNLAHARPASFQLASNCWAVTCCGRVRASGGGSSTNVCVSTNLQLCHGTGARESIALLSNVETDVTDSVSFRLGLAKMWERQKVSCFSAVAKAAKHLHSQHGEVSAGKFVASELRKARRARCRKRFIFWESVAAQLAEQG
jgi:hypothetical protein